MNLRITAVPAPNDPAEMQLVFTEVIADSPTGGAVRVRGAVQFPHEHVRGLATLIDTLVAVIPGAPAVQWTGEPVERFQMPAGFDRAIKFAAGMVGGRK